MINVSDIVKEAYQKSTTQVDKIIFNNKEYRIKNVQYYDDCYDEGNIFGTAIARCVEFEIENSIDLEKKEFEYLTGIIIEGKTHWISLGNFITQDIESNDTTGIAKIVAMDYMLKSNIKYKTNLDYSSNKITLLQVLQEACNEAGLVLATLDFANKDFIVDSNQFTEDTLIRQVIQAVAQLSGTFAKIRSDNKLYFITPQKETATVKTIDEMTVQEVNNWVIGKSYSNNNCNLSDYKELELKRQTHPINTVSLGMADIEGENITLRDEENISKNGENILRINDNPFAYTQEKREQLITALFETVKGFEYTSYEIKGQAKPYLETGDEIIVIDKNGNRKESFLFRFNYKSPNGLESEMSAPSIIKATVAYQNVPSALDIAKRTEIIVDKQNQKIEAVIEQQDDQEKKISKIEQDIDGITTTVANNKTEINEALQETKEDLETKINVSAEGVESKVSKTLESYSTTEQTNTKINSAKTEAINTAGTNTDNKLKNYSTTTQMNSAISQSAEEIRTSVSSTYITKTDSATNISNAKAEAISSANTNTTNKLKDYSKTTEMNSAINQKANEITSTVEQNISTAKTEAINSANTNTTNKLKSYSTTEQMNSAIQQKADSITSTVESKITTAVNNINIGGRNLLKNSKQTISNSNYNIAKFYLTETPKNGEKYTFTLKGTLGEGKTAFNIYNSGGNIRLGALVYDSSKDVYSLTFNWTNKYGSIIANNTYINIYTFTNDVTATSTIEWVKLEKGNKATDWTPAPEDIENELTVTEEKVTKIEQNVDSITQSVTAIKDNTVENIVNGDFKNNFNNWTKSSSGIMEIKTINNVKWLHMGVYAVDVPDSIQQKITTLIENTQYKLAFNAYHAVNSEGVINANVEFYNSSNTLLSKKGTSFHLSSSEQSYNWEFSTPKTFEYAILKFWAIGYPDKEIYLKDVSVIGGALWQRVTELQLSVDGVKSEVKEKVNDSELGTKIQQNAQSVQIAWNKISEFIQFLNAQLQIKDSNKNLLMKLDKNGQAFWRNSSYVGSICANQYKQDNTKKGLDFDLNDGGHYMTWAATNSEGLIMKLTYAREGAINGYSEGLNLGTNLNLNSFSIKSEKGDIIPFDSGIGIRTLTSFNITNSENNVIGEFSNTGLSMYRNIDMKGHDIVNCGNYSSDGRLKKSIFNSKITAIDRIKKMKHREFIWKDNELYEQIGYIAQELEKIDKNYVKQNIEKDENGNIVSDRYEIRILPLISTTTKAIQEQQEIIEKQNKIISNQQEFLKIIKDKLNLQKEYDDIFKVNNLKRNVRKTEKETIYNQEINTKENKFLHIPKAKEKIIQKLKNGEINFIEKEDLELKEEK